LQDELRELSASSIAQGHSNKTVLSALDVKNDIPEVCLTPVGTTLEFPRSMDLLDDPDIWIADSGCSAHYTGHKHGMIDVEEHESSHRYSTISLFDLKNSTRFNCAAFAAFLPLEHWHI
jgi:hypothetical protein